MMTDRSRFAEHFTANLQAFLETYLPPNATTITMLTQAQELTTYYVTHIMSAIQEHPDIDEAPSKRPPAEPLIC